jgi:hypothetical protein
VTETIHGIIVSYEAGRGTLLLSRGTEAALARLASIYLKSRVDKGFWFARFDWAVIATADKQDLKGKLKNLLGRRVICKVAQDPKWRATWLSIDLDSKRVVLPERRRNPIRSRPTKKNSSSRPRQEAPSLNNLARPWGGMKG